MLCTATSIIQILLAEKWIVRKRHYELHFRRPTIKVLLEPFDLGLRLAGVIQLSLFEEIDSLEVQGANLERIVVESIAGNHEAVHSESLGKREVGTVLVVSESGHKGDFGSNELDSTEETVVLAAVILVAHCYIDFAEVVGHVA